MPGRDRPAEYPIPNPKGRQWANNPAGNDMAWNLPPGVTGNEPEIAGWPDDDMPRVLMLFLSSLSEADANDVDLWLDGNPDAVDEMRGITFPLTTPRPLKFAHIPKGRSSVEETDRQRPMANKVKTGWVLRDLGSGAGFAVDDPIEGSSFTTLLFHADVWETKERAVQAGKSRGYVGVTPVEVHLDPKRDRATAVDFVVKR